MTRLIFGESLPCRPCRGTGQLRGEPCRACGGRGLTGVVPVEPPPPSAHARRTDPDTSHAAAASIPSDRIRKSQAFLLAVLRSIGPATDEDIWPHVQYDMSPSGARTRRSELVYLGRVVDTGKRRTLASGRKAIIWRATKENDDAP